MITPIQELARYYIRQFPNNTMSQQCFHGSPIEIDLAQVFTQIYCADLVTARDSQLPAICVQVPVSDPDKWAAVEPILIDLVRYVSEDALNISFVKAQPFCSMALFSESGYDSVTLLSGGLDSYCGFSKNEIDHSKSVYMTFLQRGLVERGRQRTILSNVNAHMNQYSRIQAFQPLPVTRTTHSQRTRALFFMALGVMTAGQFGASEVLIYENGPLSIHPRYFDRHVTKSTHPKTIFLMNEILSILGSSIRIRNPFFFKTKGEILELLSADLLSQAKETWSCGTSTQDSRWREKQHKHCGYCSPCILRKMAFLAAGEVSSDDAYFIPIDSAVRATMRQTISSKVVSDYNSVLVYYQKYQHAIRTNSICNDWGLKNAYFTDTAWKDDTMNMLRRFEMEIDGFWNSNGQLY